MTSTPPGRIPFEEISGAKPWALPKVKGQPVNCEEQRARKTKAVQNRVKQTQRAVPQAPVVSEEVEAKVEPASHKITAQQLEEITQAAEQDGFAKGYAEGTEQGKQDGRKAGYSDGLKAGTEQAESEHGQWLREQGEHLLSLTQSLLAPIAEQQEALADCVLDLAMGLAQHILDAELKHNPSALIAVVDKALLALPSLEKQITLTLNPDDAEIFREYSPKASSIEQIKIDPAMARGGCIVQSANSFVDYSIKTRLGEFILALENKPFDESQANAEIPHFEREVRVQKDPDCAATESAMTQRNLEADSKLEQDPVETREAVSTAETPNPHAEVSAQEDDRDSKTTQAMPDGGESDHD